MPITGASEIFPGLFHDKGGAVFNAKHPDFAGGAKGDGVSNDDLAFQALSAAVMAAGGGTVIIPPGVYRVGTQTLAGAAGLGYAYACANVIKVTGCPRLVTILGYGATLKAMDGLKFGSFNPTTGLANAPAMPNTNLDYRADAPEMVDVSFNVGGVIIDGLDLDGNLANLNVGGTWGDVGYQINSDGIIAYGVQHGLTLRNVHTHHHGRDGYIIGYAGMVATDPAQPISLENVISEYNGRQALSWVGGRGLTASGCKFNHTGKAINTGKGGPLTSAPGAGLDIEAEGATIRAGIFISCEFANTVGPCMVADVGDVKDIRFVNCDFWGTTSYAIWPKLPGLVFEQCRMHGSCLFTPAGVTPYNVFRDCDFDDVLYPLTGTIFRSGYGFDGGGVVGAHFDGGSLTAVGQRTVYMLANAKRDVTYRRFRFILKYSALANLDNMGSFGLSIMSDVEFVDAYTTPPATGYSLGFSGNVEVRDGVRITGPKTRMDNPTTGAQGLISTTAAAGTPITGGTGTPLTGAYAADTATLLQASQRVLALENVLRLRGLL